MNPNIAIVSVFLYLASTANAQTSAQGVVVPDPNTAIATARAALTSAYGASTVIDEEPLVATDKGDLWLVDGTLKGGIGGTTPVQIRKSDGRIISMIAYQ